MESWAEVGERIRQARLASRMSQSELAAALGIDRSALARIEGGQRQVTALELFRLSDTLHVPLAHFVTRSPAAVVSRRRELADDADHVTRARFRMDAALEAHARDAEWLAAQGFLSPAAVTASGSAGLEFTGEAGDPSAAARTLRRQLGYGLDPIGALADACGRAGLHVLVVQGLEAGASLLIDHGLGVAIIGGDDQPGRRRLTAAHELGHFILQDEYTTDIGVAASRDEREQRIDAFALEFLLPRDGLIAEWERLPEQSTRQRLIRIAGTYRVSWSVAARATCEAELVDKAYADQMQSRTAQRGEFLEILGHEPPEDLTPGETSPQWTQGSLAAWRSGAITASRVVELLHGAITESELPDREEPDRL